MAGIGVIDDRDIDRGLIVDFLNLAKTDDDWIVVDSNPLSTFAEYPAWISQNKICVLIIDERLGEELDEGIAVEYDGHDLVDYLRKKFPTLPIFVITNYIGDQNLQERFKDVEGIFDRSDYLSDHAKHTPRILRSAQQYLNIFQEELRQLADYAHKAAVGDEISEDEINRARAIQMKLETSYSVDQLSDIGKWLEETDTLLSELENLREKIKDQIGGDS